MGPFRHKVVFPHPVLLDMTVRVSIKFALNLYIYMHLGVFYVIWQFIFVIAITLFIKMQKEKPK